MCNNCKDSETNIPPVFRGKNFIFIETPYFKFKPMLNEYKNKDIYPFIYLTSAGNGKVQYVINLETYDRVAKTMNKNWKRISFIQNVGRENEKEFFRKISNGDTSFAIADIPNFLEKIVNAIQQIIQKKKSTENTTILISAKNSFPTEADPCYACLGSPCGTDCTCCD